MKLFYLAIAGIITVTAAEVAQAASISNSSLFTVDETTPDQQNVSPRSMTRNDARQANSRYSNYPTDKDYPQGQSDKETISNSFIGILESDTKGEIDVVNSSIGLVNPKDADKVNLINSSVGVVRSKNRPDVDDTNSKLGAIESTAPKNQQNPFQGGGGAQAPQGNPLSAFGPGGMGSGGSSSDSNTGYPTDQDYASGASRTMSPFAGGQASVKAVPEPSSAFATLLTGALAGGLILKRKLKQQKPNW